MNRAGGWSRGLAAVLMLTLAVGVARGQEAAEAEEPMNVVVLVSDDQRWDSLGAAGNDVIHTPRLDGLADDGVHFTDAYVTTSICMTSRASILTGQLMSRHGITRFGKQIEPEAFSETYTGMLREAGYWTGFVGKYGVGAIRQEDFDFARSYGGRHWMQDSDGERIHVTERNARDSIEFLRERPKDQPFALSVSYFAPHAEDRAEEQYLPQEWSGEFYEDVRIPPTPKGEEYLEALPEFIQQEDNEGRVRYHWRFDTPERYQAYMKRYYRLITEVDEAVGRVVDELKEQGVYENTLIVFIGDNGYFHADRGLADKWYPYEESIRVPMIVHDPRLAEDERGVKVDEMTLNIDIAPTVMKAAGLSVPEAVQGKDLSPLYLSDETPEWRDEFLYEHPTISNKERIPTSHALVRKDMKYVHWPEWDHEQLFDLEADPSEKHNLADDPDYADELEAMRQRMEALYEESAAGARSAAGPGYQATDGVVGRAGRFNGQTALTVARTPALDANDAFTWSLWARLDRPTRLIAGNRRRNGQDSLQFVKFTGHDFQYFNGSDSVQIGHGGDLPTGDWLHLAAVKDGQTLRLYRDGDAVGRASVDFGVPSLPFNLGGDRAAGEYLAGALDEVRLYDRALSEDEIQQLAEQQEVERGLWRHWSLNEAPETLNARR